MSCIEKYLLQNELNGSCRSRVNKTETIFAKVKNSVRKYINKHLSKKRGLV